MRKRILLMVGLFAWLVVAPKLYGQVDRLIKQGDHYAIRGNHGSAVTNYLKAVEKGARNEHVCRGLGASYMQLGNMVQSELWYAELMKYMSIEDADIHAYATALKRNGKFAEYEGQMEALAGSTSSERSRDVRSEVEQVRALYANSSRFEIAPVKINSESDERSPAWLSAEQILYSTKTSSSATNLLAKTLGNVDIRIAQRETSGELSGTVPLNGNVNSIANENSAIWARSGKGIIVARSSTSNTSILSSGLFYAENQGSDMWQIVGPFLGDTNYVAMDPTLSYDRRYLVFASETLGGKGGWDLYACKRSDAGWSTPIALGENVNTPGNERAPYLDANGVLYFASDALPGLGGYDIYMARPLSEGGYAGPINIGAPINSGGNDIDFMLDPTESSGYIASDRSGGQGGYDIYRFSLKGPMEELPYYCAGVSFDESTDLPRGNVLVQALDENDQEVDCAMTDSQGRYTLRMDPKVPVRIVASVPGFAVTQLWLGTPDMEKGRAAIRDIHLLPLGRTYVRGNVKCGDSGEMASDVELTFMDMVNYIEYTTRTDASGEFRFLSPLNSSYELRVMMPGYFTTVYSVRTGHNVDVVDVLGGDPIILDKIERDSPVGLPYALELGTVEQQIEMNALAERLADNAGLKVAIAVNTSSALMQANKDPMGLALNVIDELERKGVPKGRLEPRVMNVPELSAKIAYVVTGF